MKITTAFLRHVERVDTHIEDFERYPFSIPSVRHLQKLELHPKVTFFIGENGSGKSTLIEAIAIAAGLNPEGGSKDLRFATRRTESELHKHLKLVRGHKRERSSFFLRAESFYNLASAVDEVAGTGAYGGISLHEQSHGESFLALVTERFGPDGLYILDEPEAALSPQRQLSLLARIDQLVEDNCQLIIATHSPIVMAYPDALIYEFSDDGIAQVAYEDTEHFQLTRDFLNHRGRYLRHLLGATEEE
ncbi:MAG: AAA family ATPase [Bradymonadaceae bacterium]|nr:AAA family ATPase [Lujinxingiaceae bacterium]